MQNPQRRWRLYRLAKACFCRPSDLLGVEDRYTAFCLDEAIILWGETLEAELERVTEKAKSRKSAEGKQKLILEKWLGTNKVKGKKQYATPTPTV